METVEAAWEKVAAQLSGHVKDQPDYVVASLNKDLSVELLSTGHAGPDAGGARGKVVSLLGEHSDKLTFGAFKVTGVDNRGTTISFRSKFVHFIHRGETAPAMLKAKAGVNAGLMTSPFQGTTISIASDGDLDDYSEKELESRLMGAGAAHKPTSYDFVNEYDEEEKQ